MVGEDGKEKILREFGEKISKQEDIPPEFTDALNETINEEVDVKEKSIKPVPANRDAKVMFRSTEFIKELETVINKYSMENESNTPDFILAPFLRECLRVFAGVTVKRDEWFGYNTDIITREHPISADDLKYILSKVSIENIDGRTLVLQKIYNSAVLRTKEGNEFAICMRDDGFEMSVPGSDKWYRVDVETGEIKEM